MQQSLRPFVAETPSSAIAGPQGRTEPIERADTGLSFDEQLQESSLAAATETAVAQRDVVEPGAHVPETTGNILPLPGSRSPPDGASPGNPPPPDIAIAETPPGMHSDTGRPIAAPPVPAVPATDAHPRANPGVVEDGIAVAGPNPNGGSTAMPESASAANRAQIAVSNSSQPPHAVTAATSAAQPAVAAKAAEVPQSPPVAHPRADGAEPLQRMAGNVDATRRRESAAGVRTGGSGGGSADSIPPAKAAGATPVPAVRGEAPQHPIGVENAVPNPRSRQPGNQAAQLAEPSSAVPRQTPAPDTATANRGIPDMTDRRGAPELAGVNRPDPAMPGTQGPGNRHADRVERFVAELQEASTLSGDAHKAKPSSALPPAPAQSATITATVAAPVHSSSAAPAPQAATPAFTVNAPVLDPAWGAAVNDRLVWMAGRNIQSAEIRLNPAELGPLQVQVSVDEKSVNITFNAAHAVTRDALESALPRLKDMLLENGMSLEGATVSDHGIGSQRDRGGQGDGAPAGEWIDDNDLSAAADQPSRPARSVQGLVDTYV